MTLKVAPNREFHGESAEDPWQLCDCTVALLFPLPSLFPSPFPAHQDLSQSLLPEKPNMQKENRETPSCSTTYVNQISALGATESQGC